MDNLTHSLVGLAAAKAGLERTSPLATAVCIIAANAPDADIVMLLAGPSTYLEHHRGITHSIIGTLALAFILSLLVYAIERAVAHVRHTQARAKFGGLLISSLILSASHPLLDWTNSYGVRPLLPWSGQWFYGDLVFILDPWIWLLTGGACFLLTATTRWRTFGWAVLALVPTAVILLLPPRPGMEIHFAARALWVAGIVALAFLHRSKITERAGRSVAAVALALLVAYWGALALLHARAATRANVLAEQWATENGERVMRVAAMPLPANPLVWRCVAETNRAVTRFDLALDAGGDDAGVSNSRRIEKPQGEAGERVGRAAADSRAGIFLGFARFPVASLRRDCAGETFVQFVDLRFNEPSSRAQGGSFAVEIPSE